MDMAGDISIAGTVSKRVVLFMSSTLERHGSCGQTVEDKEREDEPADGLGKAAEFCFRLLAGQGVNTHKGCQ